MKIANIDFGVNPVFLAPMENVTDPSFRYICKYFGADMMYTEFIAADGLIRDARKSVAKLNIFEYERPIGIQIYGHEIQPMVEAAILSEKVNPDVIDINFGCPVRKIANRGAGSGMMQFPDKMIEMTQKIVNSVKTPVTVKTRLGWDDNSKIIIELSEQLQDVGVAAITIHGRTRSQLYKGEADWTLIGEVKKNQRMKIPIIGNGDINSPQKAKEMFDNYGVDAIMIGRATYGTPWIFRDIKHYLKTGQLFETPSVKERVEIAKKHLLKSIEIKGDKVGVIEMRRHLSSYFKNIPNFKETRLKLVTTNEPEELIKILDFIDEKWG